MYVRHTFDSQSVSHAIGTQCQSVSHAFGTETVNLQPPPPHLHLFLSLPPSRPISLPHALSHARPHSLPYPSLSLSLLPFPAYSPFLALFIWSCQYIEEEGRWSFYGIGQL